MFEERRWRMVRDSSRNPPHSIAFPCPLGLQPLKKLRRGSGRTLETRTFPIIGFPARVLTHFFANLRIRLFKLARSYELSRDPSKIGRNLEFLAGIDWSRRKTMPEEETL